MKYVGPAMFTILHVDNSTFFMHIFKEYFGKMGYSCLSARDIDSAYYFLQNGKVDLIVTALEIKGGGAENFIKSLNSSEYKNIPVVVVTSNDSLETRRSLFSLGVIDYIQKTKDFTEHLHDFINTMTEKDRTKTMLASMKFAVLDDSRMELGIIKNILHLNGIREIDFYTDPFALLESGIPYHVYFIDVVLPDISGEQVILSLRKRKRDCVIIAISGIDNYKVIANVLLSGADDYIMKPFNASIFMARLVSNTRVHMIAKDLEKKNNELNAVAVTDELTGMFNRSRIHSLLEEQVRKSRHAGGDLSIILLGIDNVSSINDEFGCKVGDRVIQSAANTIRESIGRESFVGRYGGVEFMLILPRTGLDGANLLAEKIRRRIDRHSLKGRKLSASGGVVQLDDQDAVGLEMDAGSLLRNARKRGGNRIEK